MRIRARKGARHEGLIAASVLPSGDEPPTEFCIYKAGLNTTLKGDLLFDEQAARDVLATFANHGVDMMIDLEHLSLDDEGPNFDPDARGWCRLELRNGELWATDVSWTADGDARLREKRQRFISPVSIYDKKTRRIEKLLNIAITALPATDNLEPLVAASLNGEEELMTQEQLAAIAEALDLGPDASVEDILATIGAMVKKLTDAANGTSEEPKPEEIAIAKDPPLEEQPAPMAAANRLCAASRVLVRLTGRKEIGEAMSEVETWRKSHIELETERAKLTTERTTLESSERRKLVGELVKLKAETPATAWAKDKDGIPDGKTPVDRLANEPIAELRARVTQLTPKGTRRENDPLRPPTKTDEKHGLTERELAMCTERKIDPAKYAATRAAIKARSNTSNA
jgi:Mu-like prophage I protein